MRLFFDLESANEDECIVEDGKIARSECQSVDDANFFEIRYEVKTVITS